jgi:hypothetical protein
MKLEPLANVKKANRLKMIITTEQFHRLAQNVINEQELDTIKKTYLVKQPNNGKKKYKKNRNQLS